MAKGRKTIGNPPGYGNFNIIAKFHDVLYKAEWHLYMDDSQDPEWISYKLISVKHVAAKSANYALSFNKTEKRLSGRGMFMMYMYMPHLLDWFFDVTGVDPKCYCKDRFLSLEEMKRSFFEQNKE